MAYAPATHYLGSKNRQIIAVVIIIVIIIIIMTTTITTIAFLKLSTEIP